MRRSIVFASAITLLAACSTKEIDFQTPVQDDVVFYASFEQPGDEGTRVYANEDLLLRWTADDRVSIFNKNTYNQQYKFTGTTGDNSGGFSIVNGSDFISSNPIPDIVSVYPYQASTSISEDEVLSVELPVQQTYAENSFGPGANMMVSVTDDNFLIYKNLGGYLKLRLYGNGVQVSSITLKGNNGEKIAGQASVTLPRGGVPTVSMDDAADTQVTLKCDSPVTVGTTADNSTSFWIVLPPVTFSKGFTIEVAGPTGTLFEKSTGKSITISRNTLSKMAPIELEYVLYTDLSAEKTANCYVVPGKGAYRFNACVIGNGQGGLLTGFHSSSVAISPKSAELLWDDNSIISSVSFESGSVYFMTTGNLGNALIGVKDASGTILWSWHIWSTQNISTVTWYSKDQVMDRDLGARKASSSNVEDIRGLFYQWGRKDPFRKDNYDKVATSAETGTINYAIAHPNTFITGFDSTTMSDYRRGNWMWGSSFPKNLWGNPSMGNSCTKTIYDPCPPGYKLPSLNTWKNVTRKSYNSNGVTFNVASSKTALFTYGSINQAGNWHDYDNTYKGSAGRSTTSCTFNTSDNALIGSVVFITDKFFKVNNGDFRSQAFQTRCIKE